MTNRLLRCGIVGLGNMGRNHARVISEHPATQLVAVADTAAPLPELPMPDGLLVTSKVSELLSLELDFVVIATPTSSHEKLALTFAKEGTPVLIEKPLSNSFSSGKRIVDAFRRHNVHAAVGHVERFNPAILEMKKVIQSDRLGFIYQISTRRQSSLPKRISDVGVTLDLASHDIDTVHEISGERYQEIDAYSYRREGQTFEELLSAVGKLSRGTVVSHQVNWLSPVKERTTTALCEGGLLVADTLLGDLTIYEPGSSRNDWQHYSNFRGVSEGSAVRLAFDRHEPLRAQLDHFVSALSSFSGDQFHELERALEVVRIAEEMLNTAKKTL